jgi:hypothetical protein
MRVLQGRDPGRFMKARANEAPVERPLLQYPRTDVAQNHAPLATT